MGEIRWGKRSVTASERPQRKWNTKDDATVRRSVYFIFKNKNSGSHRRIDKIINEFVAGLGTCFVWMCVCLGVFTGSKGPVARPQQAKNRLPHFLLHTLHTAARTPQTLAWRKTTCHPQSNKHMPPFSGLTLKSCTALLDLVSRLQSWILITD